MLLPIYHFQISFCDCVYMSLKMEDSKVLPVCKLTKENSKLSSVCTLTMEDSNVSSMSQYCEISTCMGVTDYYLTKSVCGKMFWSSLIILGLGITLFQTYFTFAEYFTESPFKASISKETLGSGIKFPRITICNFNRAKQSVINATQVDIKVLSAMFQLLPTNYDIPMSFMDANTVQVYQDALAKYVAFAGDSDPRNFFRKYGQNANETLITATFANGDAILADSFTEKFTVYGRCWRLDVNNSQQIPGNIIRYRLEQMEKLSISKVHLLE